MRRDVRILLVGDEGVGKSTIVTSLIKESFVPHVQHIVPEVTIPPEVTPEDVTTYIVDSGNSDADRSHLESEIRKAHVICIVYAIDDPNSFSRIPAHWLPYFRQLGVNVPVILVGNKIDLRGGEVTNEALEDEIIPIMNEFKEVETCVECSALANVNVSEVFYFAQKAVLHPTAPLYDSRDHVLKRDCVAALRRIFKLCDTNKDGVLDGQELNEFQSKCFDTPLQAQELEGIKDMVREHSASGVQGDGLTEAGFLYLHTMFIQRGRLETTWTVLRQFGYGEDLRLTEAFLYPKFEVPHDCSVELSPLGYKFFTDIFEAYDKDQDGALKTEELNDLFSTSPGNPWANQKFPDTTVADDTGAVTLQGWLAQWSMTTLLEHKTTLAYLSYLGHPQPLSALQITRPRKTERRKGSGKTSLLRAFVGRKFSDAYNTTKRMNSVVNSVDIEGSEKYLVLQEFGSNYEPEMLKSSKKLDLADVIIYVYDSSDTNSFSYISGLRQRYNLDHIPTLFVATKSDLDLAQQSLRAQVYLVSPNLTQPRTQNNPRLIAIDTTSRTSMDEDMDFDSGNAPQQQPQIQPTYQDTNGHTDGRKMLDLVFVQDCTGSQGSYITSATKNIQSICQHIFESGKLQSPEDLRIGLVAYRDHPPQDHTYVTKNFGFSSDISKVESDLGSLYASGGGDGPEAVTAGLAEALNMDWRPQASKMVVLIADAPPHGIGEYGDGFEDGSPDGNDPLQLARAMAGRGITLFFVACEPALSGYAYATDFFQAMTNITSGLMLPLTTADLLTHAIVGSVLENLDMERLVREVGQAVSQRILGNNESVDDVARELHERLLLRNESTKKVVIESIYRESEEAKHNTSVYMQAASLAEARPLLRRVPGTRFTDKYLHSRMSSGRSYPYAPYLPTRKTTSPSTSTSSPTIPTPSHSPPRKVVTDFAAFGAPSTASVFGTKVASTPFSLAGGKAAFGGIRGGVRGGFDDDEEEEEDNGRQKVELREDSITLDQARRIAMQSAWRSARA
ncbi:ERMES complex Ca(2+)-binding regulatory GTPase gem1 [Steccherinum ochraceum]|uniref:Mitochondrial Rho GTPase 1 n=1 Tax=Steccherinum ochraceum TaxID=92696 RepID=A0A4R0RQ88_9APHY|nr:ERMES complex Ca(2+)-binding regulatory GTPase gem1 [Steccherinum ochraceum]